MAANDFDKYSVEAFCACHPSTQFLHGPIEELSPKDFLKTTGLHPGELDCLIGGPPCQAFSVYNHQRGLHDERSGLFREYLRLVAGLKPKFVVMENVTGITSVGSGRAVEEIHRGLKKLGYYVESRILKAEEFGVPQERRRIFFIGSRVSDEIPWPTPTHFGNSLDVFAKGEPFVSVWDAIGDLPELKLGDGFEILEYDKKPFSKYQLLMRNGAKYLYNHVSPQLSEINLKRIEYIPPGGSWRDIPERLLPAGMKRARRSDHTKRYGRLHPSGLACTILTKCDPHWGAYIHPKQDRALTVREAARLQSFPDRIRFFGPRVEQYRQVGNAVPPLLAKAVAEGIAEMLVSNQALSGAFSAH